ncbi:MAG TPA: DUF4386 domain-containing protein [Actinomycetes bacterium]|nr:DUF4386 domain-containing protein [Actinomycetes bacterium]
MVGRTVVMSQRQVALIGGFAYVAISALALFANFLVLERLVDPDDAATTVGNIVTSEVLFRSGIAAFLIVFILDVVVAWALYVVFSRANRELSLLAAWLRVVYAAVASTALLSLLVVVQIVDDTGYATAFVEGERNAQAMLFLDAFDYGWSIGLVIFGAHLLILGLVIVKSAFAPRLMGILVALAGLGYLLDNLARVLFPNYQDYEGLFLLLVAIVAIPAEFWLTGWLLFRGGKADQRAQPPTVVTQVGARPVG